MNIEILTPVLCELLAKSALLLLAAALVERAWTRASAAQRHLVWCAAFGAMLLLPATRCFEPRWTVPMQRVRVELPRVQAATLAPAQSLSASVATPIPAARGRWPDWRHGIIHAWAAGAGLLLTRRLLGSVQLIGLRRMTRPLVDVRARRFAASIFRELGIRRAIALRLSPGGCVPVTWGSLRPVLTLPAEALEWSDTRLASALRHEAGHIVRGDHLTRLLAHLACIFYWPNPLVWLAARRLRIAQEEATDDLVLRAGIAPDEYAAQLFDVARTLAARHNLAAHAVAMACPSTLERRMLAIVDAERDRRPLTIGAITGGVLAVAITLGIATAAQVHAQTEAAPPLRGAVKEEAAPAGDASRSMGPQIVIEAKFIEISGDRADLPVFVKQPDSDTKNAIRAILSDADVQAALRALNQTKGVDLLSAPRVTTHTGQRAVIEIVREFRYTTEWDKGAGTGEWKEKTFATKDVGVTFDVTPEAKSDGTISLHLVPEVTEFEGFKDLDAKPSAATPLDHDERAEGRRRQPIFSTRKIDTQVTARSGETIVLGGLQRTDVQIVEDKVPILGDVPLIGRFFTSTEERHIRRSLFVLVTARIVEAGEGSVVKPVKTGTLDIPAGFYRAAEAEIQPRADGDAEPEAKPVPSKPGYVTSPFDPGAGYIDVRGMPAGTKVKDPYSGKVFRVPEAR